MAHALKEFEVDVTGLVCADFGCSTGGFTDCLLQNGAAKVYALDTGYNVIDYKLRSDDRVVVMERTNTLFVVFPGEDKKKRKYSIMSPSPFRIGARSEGSTKFKAALDPEYLTFVRKLCKEQTDAESLMWYLLRDQRLLDLKFRRQHPVEHYVLDFYCEELKLAIELDGGHHNEPKNKKKDKKRTEYIKKQGIYILRFWDNEVLKETEAVLESICYFVQNERGENKREDPHPSPLPKGEGIRGEDMKGVDLITIDLGWTKQLHAIPAALKWLKQSATNSGRIISLIKPHYETNNQEKADWLVDGALPPDRSEQVLNRVLGEFPDYGAEVLGCTISPIKGGKSSRKKKGQGNTEYLVLARPITQSQ